MQAAGKRRFEALLTGSSAEAHDRPLLERDKWIVAPTLGAIVPGWLLAIPRQPVLSFRDWAAVGGQPACEVLADVRSELGLAAEEAIWFEHGPGVDGTVVGCGLDHAHLHILIRPPFGFGELVEQARASATLDWCETSVIDSYATLSSAGSYFVAGCGDRAISAQGVEAAGSQFFRRVVATLVGETSGWDYRSSPQTRNIEATVSIFESLTEIGRRGG